MNFKNATFKEWFTSGSKTEIILKKILLVLITSYLLYKLGYAVGAFIANIGL